MRPRTYWYKCRKRKTRSRKNDISDLTSTNEKTAMLRGERRTLCRISIALKWSTTRSGSGRSAPAGMCHAGQGRRRGHGGTTACERDGFDQDGTRCADLFGAILHVVTELDESLEQPQKSALSVSGKGGATTPLALHEVPYRVPR